MNRTVNKVAKLDTKKFNDSITENIKFNAGRLDITECATDDDRHVHAAAVAISQLMILRTHADAKPLNRQDIQRAIDAAMDGYNVEEYRGPMGDCRFRTILKFKKLDKTVRLMYKNIKPGCHIKLNSQEDAIVWLVTEKDGNTLTVRERDYPRNAAQYTDVSLVAEVAK